MSARNDVTGMQSSFPSRPGEVPPKTVIREIMQRWPNAWRQADVFREARGADGIPNWPDWCYLPIHAGVAIATQGRPNPEIQLSVWPALISGIASWRVTQGVYRFDPDLFRMLIEQPMEGVIPCATLYRLPEWAVYIETPGMKFPLGNRNLVGVLAYLDWDENRQAINELRFVLFSGDGYRSLMSILLGDWTIEEAIQHIYDEALKNSGEFGRQMAAVPVEQVLPPDYFTRLVNLTLYLCAENADMLVRPHPSTRVSAIGKLQPPKEPKSWDVGIRIGSAIRKYENEKIQGTTPRDDSTSHNSPRPHVRRAHWHSFWTGPKDLKDRKLAIRWLPPIPVNVQQENGENPVVLHRVK